MPVAAEVLGRLGSFLDQIHRQIPIGTRTRLECERLQRAWPGIGMQELRAALASLIARSPEEWGDVARLFDQWLEQVPAQTPDAAAASSESARFGAVQRLPGKPWVLSRAARSLAAGLRHAPPRVWIGALAALSLSIVWAVVDSLPERAGVKSEIFAPPPPLPPPPLPPPPLPPRPPPAPEKDFYVLREITPEGSLVREIPSYSPEDPAVLEGLAVFSAALVLAGLRFAGLPRAGARRWRREREAARRAQALRRERLDEEKAARGSSLRVDYRVPRHAPLLPRVIADSAGWLGRLQSAERGPELDADATVRRSAEQAGRFQPVLAARRSPVELLLWIDVEGGDHPWLGSFRCLLEAWQRLGIRLQAYEFEHVPETFVEPRTRAKSSLAELARRHAGEPLVVFSRYLSPESMKGPSRWTRECAAWPARAWLDPCPRSPADWSQARRREVARLERLGFARFPLSELGLEHLVRALCGDAPLRPPSEKDPLPPLPLRSAAPRDPLAEALRTWALAAAWVPDPTWNQLEAIRRHFPEIHRVLGAARDLQLLLEWVDRECGERAESSDGAKLQISPRAEDDWKREQRRLEAAGAVTRGFERRVHELFKQQLDPSCPEDPLDALCWRFKSHLHQAFLEPERARELLGPLLDSEIGADVGAVLGPELARQADEPGAQFPLADRRALAARVGLAEPAHAGVPARALVVGHPRLWWVAAAAALLCGHLWVSALPGLEGWIGARVSPPRRSEVRWASVSALQRVSVVEPTRERLAPPVPRTARRHSPPAVVEPLRGRTAPELVQPLATAHDRAAVEPTRERPALVVLPGGTFQMGSPSSEKDPEGDERLHAVEVSSFVVSETEITQGQFAEVMKRELGTRCGYVGVGADLPVVCVSWEDAVAYCNRLSALEGLGPVYEGEGDGLRWDRTKNGYRLLTEAEWEYAARAGEQTIQAKTSDPEQVCEYGKGDSSGGSLPCKDPYARLGPVNLGAVNRWGLHGMGGNVSEWVWDRYGEDPGGGSNAAAKDPTGPGASWSLGIRRASWFHVPRGQRVATRVWLGPSLRGEIVGFRVARSVLPSDR